MCPVLLPVTLLRQPTAASTQHGRKARSQPPAPPSALDPGRRPPGPRPAGLPGEATGTRAVACVASCPPEGSTPGRPAHMGSHQGHSAQRTRPGSRLGWGPHSAGRALPGSDLLQPQVNKWGAECPGREFLDRPHMAPPPTSARTRFGNTPRLGPPRARGPAEEGATVSGGAHTMMSPRPATCKGTPSMLGG